MKQSGAKFTAMGIKKLLVFNNMNQNTIRIVVYFSALSIQES